jgi:hypothetical protein
VIPVFTASRSQIPGSGCTTPNPDKAPRPTHPDQIATNAGNANTTTVHTRTAEAQFLAVGEGAALWLVEAACGLCADAGQDGPSRRARRAG